MVVKSISYSTHCKYSKIFLWEEEKGTQDYNYSSYNIQRSFFFGINFEEINIVMKN